MGKGTLASYSWEEETSLQDLQSLNRLALLDKQILNNHKKTNEFLISKFGIQKVEKKDEMPMILGKGCEKKMIPMILG